MIIFKMLALLPLLLALLLLAASLPEVPAGGNRRNPQRKSSRSRSSQRAVRSAAEWPVVFRTPPATTSNASAPFEVALPGGAVAQMQLLATRPLVYQIDGLLQGCNGSGVGSGGSQRRNSEAAKSAEVDECELLVQLAAGSGGLAPSTQLLPTAEHSSTTARGKDASWRNSKSVWLRKAGARVHPLLAALNARVAAVMNVPLAAVEAGNGVQVVR